MASLQCLLYLVFVFVGSEAILSASTENNRDQSVAVYKKDGIDKSWKRDSMQAQPSIEHGYVYGHPYSGGHYGHGNVYEHNPHSYHHPPPYDPNYAIKSLLVPLAGVALLGAAAVFASNPVLLQLGVVSGKRKRRDAEEDNKLQDVAMLERFIQQQLPKESLQRQEKQILANYLSCSHRSGCLERLLCEIQHPEAKVSDLERHVLNIVMSEIYENKYVDNSVKDNMMKAREVGRAGYDCAQFYCDHLTDKF